MFNSKILSKMTKSRLNLRNVVKIGVACLAVVMLATAQGAFAQKLTYREKVDIQYQLNGIASVASGDAVEIEYEEESDVVKDARIKEAYKNAYKKFEGKVAPSDNVELLNYIEYGNKIGNTVEVTVSLDGELNGYTVTSKYDLKTRKFKNAENIFLYMCIAKNEGWEAPVIINTKEETPQETVIQNETIMEQSSESTDVITQSDNKAVTYMFLALIVVLLIAYIVAIVRTRKGLMYTFANWWDFIILMVAALCLSISLLNIFGGEATSTQWIIFSVGIIAFAGSLFMSIKINQGNGLNIAISICAKLFVFVIIALIVVLWLLGHFWQKANERALTDPNSTSSVYSDLRGIEQGEKMKKAAGGIAGFLLVSLIALNWEMPQPIEK